MGEPARKFSEIEPDIRPNLRGIDGGGQSTPGRASLKAVNGQESSTKKPDDNDDIKGAEEAPNKSWKNNVSGVGAASLKSGGFIGAVKKKSPALAIVLTLIFGGFGIVGFSGPLILPQSILANVVQKFNIQETSATIRTNKLFASKMSDPMTSGSCQIVKVFCRFSRPSNRFLKQLEKNGIKAFNSKGVIESGGLFPNARPDSYQFINEAGESTYIKASELKNTIINNAEVRDAFHQSSKTRFRSLTDSIFDGIKARFGFKTSNSLKNISPDDGTTLADGGEDIGKNAGEDVIDATDNTKSISDIVDDNVQIDDGGVAAAIAGGSDDAVEAAVKDKLTDVVTDATVQTAKTSKGDGITLAAGLICGVADVPGMMTKAVRGFQMAQLVKYSALFLATFGAIKAGEAIGEDVSAVGKLLTNPVNGKSAMDSFGMRNIMTGDISPQNSKYKKFAPGGSIIAALGGIVAVANSKIKKGACDTMTNPVTGEAINIALAANGAQTFGVTLGMAAANIAAGWAIGKVIEEFAPSIISAVMSVIPVKDIMGYFVGDLTKGLVGEDVGDALISGSSHVMGQTANLGGNMPLTVSQAVAYGEVTKEVQIAYAEEDRATKSPFDISSPNTMMGSFVQKLIPYISPSYKIAGLTSNSISSIFNVVGGSFGMILSPLSANAVDPSEEYKLCDDPEMLDNDIAAGPFCNIMYGIPPEYLDKDPVTVVNELVASGDINEDSGEVIVDSELDEWVGLCTGGDSFQARNCKITDKTANYALYTIDYRIQKSMDEEEEEASSTTSNYDGKSAKEYAQIIIDSSNVTDRTGQLKEVIDGTRTNINVKVLKIIANLSKDNKFTISELVRPKDANYGAENSQHKIGQAVDFSGNAGINGVVLNYSDYNTTIQKFVSDTASFLGGDCKEIGVPNIKYKSGVSSLPSSCSIFYDEGTGEHIHIGIVE